MFMDFAARKSCLWCGQLYRAACIYYVYSYDDVLPRHLHLLAFEVDCSL